MPNRYAHGGAVSDVILLCVLWSRSRLNSMSASESRKPGRSRRAVWFLPALLVLLLLAALLIVSDGSVLSALGYKSF